MVAALKIQRLVRDSSYMLKEENFILTESHVFAYYLILMHPMCNLWDGQTKATVGLFIDEKANEQQ